MQEVKKIISKNHPVEEYLIRQEINKEPSGVEIVAPLLMLYDNEANQDHYKSRKRNDDDVAAPGR